MKVITNVKNPENIEKIKEYIKERFSFVPEVDIINTPEDCAKCNFQGNLLVLNGEDFDSLLCYVAGGAGLVCPTFLFVRNLVVPVPCPYESAVWTAVLKNTVAALATVLKRRLEEESAKELLTEEFESVRSAFEELFNTFENTVREEVKQTTEKLL